VQLAELEDHPLGPPGIRVAPPGPRSRALATELAAAEAPGIGGFDRGRPPVVWESARGSRVRDVDGNVYVDLTAGFGVVNVGHAHPRVVAAVRDQARRLVHGMGDVFPHEPRVRLAARLARLAPLPEARVYFAASGSEAVEIALKTAHLATGRPSVAAFTGGYHGLSYGALRATARAEFRAPFESTLGPPTLRLPFPDRYRPPIDARRGTLAEACLDVSRSLLRAARSRGALPGALVVEPVQGREGIVVPPAGWLRGLAEICRELGVLFVADEILTGFGRTGARFAVEAEGVTPDLLVVGKGMAGGLPLAAAIAPAGLFRVWERGGEALHTSTFLAHPLACVGALAGLEVFEDERLTERAARWGPRLERDLKALAGAHPWIGDVRGLGCMWGIEIVGLGPQAPADPARARGAAEGCRRRGVLLTASGPRGNVLQLTPPLVLDESEWEFAVGVLREAAEDFR
jgi:4-aminobutyrate aminotransferase/(S)-3-amino-2-methylpropionate transaminase